MKQKIEHISKGEFQGITPELIFPETHLSLKIGEGEIYKGSFHIENLSDGDVRGLIYSSSLRMKSKEPGFEGSQVEVEFTYDGTGLLPGHVEKGAFTIVCNGGEYQITFAAIIEKPYIETSIGKIQDLNGFKKLAFQNFEEAQRIFRHREFYELIKYEEPRIKHIYDHMRTWNLSAHGMEEFLVAIKQKERIFLTLNAYGQSVRDLIQPHTDYLSVYKNSWGYVDVQVEVDGGFIEPSTTLFSTNDFDGPEYQFTYTIRHDLLHPGKNYGRITFVTPYERVEFVIEAHNGGLLDHSHRTNDFIYANLMKLYLQLEAEAISLENWYVKTTNLIQDFVVKGDDDSKYRLYQAHACLIGNQPEEARWILENYTYSKYMAGRDVEMDAYYLYLQASLDRNSMQIKKAIEELQRIFMKNSRSWKVLCMLIRLDPYYNDSYEKLQSLETQFKHGARSSIIYLEAFKAYKVKSSNLKKLGNFEIQVLRFATKYNLMTKELALYTANLASQQKEYDKRIFDLLTLAYDKLKEPMILHSICTMLINGDVVEDYSFKWYDLAVKDEVKIARLFDFYMNSIDPDKVTEVLPRTIHLYFAHGNNLPYDKAALLYGNLIQFESPNSELYEYYREDIRIFALQQLGLRRISPQLRIVYRAVFKDDKLITEQLKGIYEIAHTYKLTTQVPNIRSVQVIGADGELSEKIPYNKTGARVVLYSGEDILIWETHSGERYIGTIPYESERLFFEMYFIDMCQKQLKIDHITGGGDNEPVLTYENLINQGLKPFDLEEVKDLCSKKIMDDDFEENDHLIHLCYLLFKQEAYDRSIMSYLVTYYVGPTVEMKAIWHAARDYEIATYKLAEKIITQEVFGEQIFNDEEIFVDYYNSGAHFRLLKAYLALSSREYIMYNRALPKSVVSVIVSQLKELEELTDIVKIAILKHFAYEPYEPEHKQVLKECMQALCEKQLYFTFFTRYGEEWLREVQLWDKSLIAFSTQHGGKSKLYYKLYKTGTTSPDYTCEVIAPMYENVYVKKFLIFEDETLEYYFEEIIGDEVIKSKVKVYEDNKESKNIGKFGRLNSIINCPADREDKVKAYALEDALAKKMFVPYE